MSSRSKKVGAFLYVWLNVGFAFGTLGLLGPSRWLPLFAESRGWSDALGLWLVWGVFALYLAASCVLAVWITRFLLQYRARAAKAGVLLVMTAVALLALWGWLNPEGYAKDLRGSARGEPVVEYDGPGSNEHDLGLASRTSRP
jgi:hypothetical protein